MSQSSSVASSSDGGQLAGQRARAPVDAQLDARRRCSARQRARQERRRRGAVHEQRLGGVADARLLDLRVEDDRLGGVEVGGGVDEDVAVARRGVDHRHGRDGLQRRLQPLAAAREDEVDDAVLRRQLGELLAPAAGDEADRALGHAGADAAASAAIAASTALECAADDEPRSTTALPDFRHSEAASIVTFGRAS